MPTNQHGITHAGTIGLFDDPDETAASNAHIERHEIRGLEKVIRRENKRVLRKRRKDEKRKDEKSPHHNPDKKPKLSRPASWFGTLFGGSKDVSPERTPSRLVEKVKDRRKSSPMPQGWEVVRKPATPEPVYTAQDVDLVDSPWLRECGMVRVTSGDAGGCHIVPKSRIDKSD
jgi:hypothetical protein